MFVVSFMFATQKSTNKTPKQNNSFLGTPGLQYIPFCSLHCFHIAKKVKLIANLVSINSEEPKKVTVTASFSAKFKGFFVSNSFVVPGHITCRSLKFVTIISFQLSLGELEWQLSSNRSISPR